jgi:hypothetical protein
MSRREPAQGETAMNSVENAASGGPDPKATIAMLRQALERMPGNVDAMIGLAGMHLQLGALDAAADWCARASAIAPGAKIGRIRAAVEDAYVRRGLHEIVAGRMGDAIDTLSRAAAFTGSRETLLCRDLFTVASAWFDDAARQPPEPGAIRFSLPVWGAEYVAATSGLLRSLLAPGNLPALARQHPVRLEITTSARDQALFETAPVLTAIRNHATIAYFNLPDHVLERPTPPYFPYWIMSVGHHASAERARRTGTGVSFLTADMIVSDGSLLAAQRLLDDGIQAVLVSGLEADHETLVGTDGGTSSALTLTPRDLVRHGLARLGIETSHEASTGCRVLSPVSFAIDGGLVAYRFHSHPLMVSSDLLRGDFTFDLLTVDTRFVRLALGDASPKGRVKIVCNTKDIAVVSTLSVTRGAEWREAQDYDALGRSAANMCFAPQDVAYFEWVLGHRIVFRVESPIDDAGPSELERSTVASVLSAFRRHAAASVKAQQAERISGTTTLPA